MGRKATKAEVELRQREIYKLLCNHATASEIVEYAGEKWGIKPKMAHVYLKRVRERIRADWELDRGQFMADLMTQYAALAKKAKASGHDNITLGCLNQMARLAKLTDS